MVYLCYPGQTFGHPPKPLWHFGMEQIIREVGMAAADLKKTEESYWQQQSLKDANWRIALVSRHKGSHESHPYDLVTIERIAKAVFICYLLAARKALADPTSNSQNILASTRIQRLNELLAARAQTYRVTRDLPDVLEHLRFYEAKESLSLADEKIRLLFESHLIGNGPIYYFLQSLPLSMQVEWAREYVLGADIAKKNGAAEFLFCIGEAPMLSEVADVFDAYSHRYKLAFYVRALATSSDVPVLWRWQRKKASVIREAVIESLVRYITERQRDLLEKAAQSKSEATQELFFRLALAVASPEKIEMYRRTLGEKKPVKVRFALLGLAKVGSSNDLDWVRQFMDQDRLDQWTGKVAIGALALLASRSGDSSILVGLLNDPRRHVVEAALNGLRFSEAGVPMQQVIQLYETFPAETEQVLQRCVRKEDRNDLRELLREADLDNAAKKVALALCSIGGPSDIEFLLGRIANAVSRVDFWEQYELVFAMAKKAKGAKLRSLLMRYIKPQEFWAYYGESRPPEKMPVANYENIPLVRRIVGLCFGEVATRSDIPLLVRMLEHRYWSVYHGAATGLARVGGAKELNMLVALAIKRSEEGKEIKWLLDAVCALDRKLFGNLPRALPMEAAFGEMQAMV